MRVWEPVTVKQIVACTCDVCQKSYKKDEDVVEFQEMVQISFTGGYGSIFGDMDQFELDICQHCLKEKLGQYIRKLKNWLSPESQSELAAGLLVDSFHSTNPPMHTPTEDSRPFAEDDYLAAQSRNGSKRYGDD